MPHHKEPNLLVELSGIRAVERHSHQNEGVGKTLNSDADGTVTVAGQLGAQYPRDRLETRGTRIIPAEAYRMVREIKKW